MNSKRSIHKLEKLARVYDDEILPIWSQRFGRMVLRALELPERCQVLDLACATGYPALDIIRRMGAGSRFIAIDSSSALLDVARRKVEEMGAKGVFFRSENAGARLPFADDVYDLVISNLGLADVADPATALADYARVAVPGGEVRCTLPLAGTFEEFHDIYREVLTKHDRNETLARLDEYIARAYPGPAECERWLESAQLMKGRVEVERFTMLFRSSREFFFAPIIEFGPLPAWKEIAGQGQEMQDTFWYIKEAIDAYFEGRAFAVTVVAGCLIGRKGAGSSVAAAHESRAPTGSSVATAHEPRAPTGSSVAAAHESRAPTGATGIVARPVVSPVLVTMAQAAESEATAEDHPLPVSDSVVGSSPAKPIAPDTEQEIDLEGVILGGPKRFGVEEP